MSREFSALITTSYLKKITRFNLVKINLPVQNIHTV